MATQPQLPTPTAHVSKPLKPTTIYVKEQRDGALKLLRDAIDAFKKGNVRDGISLTTFATHVLDSAKEAENGRPFPLSAFTVQIGEPNLRIPEGLPWDIGDLLVFDGGINPNQGDYILVSPRNDDENQVVEKYQELSGQAPDLTLGVLIAAVANGYMEPFVAHNVVIAQPRSRQ